MQMWCIDLVPGDTLAAQCAQTRHGWFSQSATHSVSVLHHRNIPLQKCSFRIIATAFFVKCHLLPPMHLSMTCVCVCVVPYVLFVRWRHNKRAVRVPNISVESSAECQFFVQQYTWWHAAASAAAILPSKRESSIVNIYRSSHIYYICIASALYFFSFEVCALASTTDGLCEALRCFITNVITKVTMAAAQTHPQQTEIYNIILHIYSYRYFMAWRCWCCAYAAAVACSKITYTLYYTVSAFRTCIYSVLVVHDNTGVSDVVEKWFGVQRDSSSS